MGASSGITAGISLAAWITREAAKGAATEGWGASLDCDYFLDVDRDLPPADRAVSALARAREQLRALGTDLRAEVCIDLGEVARPVRKVPKGLWQSERLEDPETPIRLYLLDDRYMARSFADYWERVVVGIDESALPEALRAAKVGANLISSRFAPSGDWTVSAWVLDR